MSVRHRANGTMGSDGGNLNTRARPLTRVSLSSGHIEQHCNDNLPGRHVRGSERPGHTLELRRGCTDRTFLLAASAEMSPLPFDVIAHFTENMLFGR